MRGARRGLVIMALVLLAGGLGWWGWMLRAPATPVPSLVVPPALALEKVFGFGAYRLAWNGRELDLLDGAGRSLWRTGGAFLSAGRTDPALRCDEQSLEGFQVAGGRLQVVGHLRCTDGRVSPYRLEMRADGGRGVLVSVSLGDSGLDHLALRWRQEPDERFRGFVGVAADDEAGGAAGGWVPMADVTAQWAGEPVESLGLVSSRRAFHSAAGARRVFLLDAAGGVSLEVEAGVLRLRVVGPAP